MGKNYNFFTEVPLDITLGKKIYRAELSVFCNIIWDLRWLPSFTLIRYKINEIKSGGKSIKSDKKIIDSISYFWQNNQKDLQQSVLKEYMTFAYIVEGKRKNPNLINNIKTNE